ILNHHLPEVFDPRSLPDQWDEEWIHIPVKDPKSRGSVETLVNELWPPLEDSLDQGAEGEDASETGRRRPSRGVDPPLPAVVMSGFAGSLRLRTGGTVPPPDALAFYLPFHYFYPKWWGIYLIAEGVDELAWILSKNSGDRLSPNE